MRYLILIALLLSACGTQVSDTTSSSEVTNGVAVVVMQDATTPLAGQTVTLVHRDDWYARKAQERSVVLGQQTSDNQGVVLFDSVPFGGYSLIVEGGHGGARRSVIFEDTVHPAETLYLASMTAVSGSMEALSGTLDMVALAGTHYEVNANAQGAFQFPMIAGEEAEVVAILDTMGSEKAPSFGRGEVITPGVNLAIGGIRAEPAAVLLDDFNDGDNESIVGWLTGHGTWYAYTDSTKAGNSQLLPTTAVDDMGTAMTTDGAYEGQSLHATFIMGDAISAPYGSIACQLRENPMEYANLKDLRRMSFRVKGKGTIRINFVSHAVDAYEPVLIRGDFGVTLLLQNEWQEVSISLDSLLPEPESPALYDSLRWGDVSDSIRSIVFGSWSNTPGDTVELYLDDIILHGLDPTLFQTD